MKKISVMIPCYNEEENVEPISKAIIDVFKTQLSNYDYEILFIDNDSQDKTREILRRMCEEDKHIKAIFNAKNFGQFNMVCFRQPVIVPFLWFAISRIR